MHDEYLQETQELNFSHPAIQTLINSIPQGSDKERAIALYNRIRDDIRYNPYTFTDGVSTLSASYAVEHEEAYCIPKAALMVAACRGLGIPARLGLANVRNHLSSKKLLDFLKTDLFVMHGYAELYLDAKWVKCTPVFNAALCEKFGIKTLEFDGETDSIFHPFTHAGQAHMEYVKDHGTFPGVPVEFIMQGVDEAYPHLSSNMQVLSADASLEKDLIDESIR